ncbi:ROK family protein [Frankia sp. CNm7]|uniref:ROK family protein n=1 Tax=Frankia nepalensis TaxID=1836974 RepID=A0A937RJD1_9ACTN|nr:ROK family protein [Frankia nepalensis]MBL7498185.1 ROK family protein [Frankia nepalensis]MBL7513151.1 ROK family protein [Frankia nepalensis]MBL7521125.1 ROK family protein [Frankia nepalensis]MBL7628419.1 ROK family protein [Frankia nepalensis]
MRVFGVDIGGSGIKGAPVETDDGTLVAPRVRLPTPSPAEPAAVAAVVAEVVGQFGWQGPVGVAFPAVVRGGVAQTAANVSSSWIGTDVATTLAEPLSGREITVINDADAAGVAEMAFGVGRDVPGLVVMTTFGTGIGTALFLHGQLIPNTELGHLELGGHDAETRASDAAREREDLSWEHWAKRVSRYLGHLEALLWPDLIIIGGGVSKRADKFLHLLTVQTKVVPAQLRNEAGIIGAAMSAGVDQTRPRVPSRAVRRRPPATRPPGGRRP